MNVTRDVIRDLWPLVEGGEATADTRALVDRFLAGDAELAAELRQQPDVQRALTTAWWRLTEDDERALIAHARTKGRWGRIADILLAALFTWIAVMFATDGWQRMFAPKPEPLKLLGGRTIGVVEHKLWAGDALVFRFVTSEAAATCTVDTEIEEAFAHLITKAQPTKPTWVMITVQLPSGKDGAGAKYQRQRDGRWLRVAGGVRGCPITEAAAAAAPDPARYYGRDWFQKQ